MKKPPSIKRFRVVNTNELPVEILLDILLTHTNAHTHTVLHKFTPEIDSYTDLPVLTMYLYYFFRIFLFLQDLGKVYNIKQPYFLLFYFSISLHLYPIHHKFLKPLLAEENRRFSVSSCDLKSPRTSVGTKEKWQQVC